MVHTLAMASVHIRFGTADRWWSSTYEEYDLKYSCVFLPYRLFFAPGPWLSFDISRKDFNVSDSSHSGLVLGKSKGKKRTIFSASCRTLSHYCPLITSKGEGQRVDGGSRHQLPQCSGLFCCCCCCSIIHSPSYLYLLFLFLTSSLTSKNTRTAVIRDPERTSITTRHFIPVKIQIKVPWFF